MPAFPEAEAELASPTAEPEAPTAEPEAEAGATSTAAEPDGEPEAGPEAESTSAAVEPEAGPPELPAEPEAEAAATEPKAEASRTGSEPAAEPEPESSTAKAGATEPAAEVAEPPAAADEAEPAAEAAQSGAAADDTEPAAEGVAPALGDEAAAAKIQARVRGKAVRAEAKADVTAAQALYRGKVARKEVRKNHAVATSARCPAPLTACIFHQAKALETFLDPANSELSKPSTAAENSTSGEPAGQPNGCQPFADTSSDSIQKEKALLSVNANADLFSPPSSMPASPTAAALLAHRLATTSMPTRGSIRSPDPGRLFMRPRPDTVRLQRPFPRRCFCCVSHHRGRLPWRFCVIAQRSELCLWIGSNRPSRCCRWPRLCWLAGQRDGAGRSPQPDLLMERSARAPP